MSLRDIYCQERGLDVLQRAYFAGRVAHAYIFAGPVGVGRFTTAKEWAKMLLCEKPKKTKKFADSCGGCASCKVFDGGAHPDLKVIQKELVTFTKDGKNKTTPIDLPIAVIREFLIEKAAERPMMSKHSVYIVKEAERLNNSSQNALLKLLEEPPKHCFIILLCSRTERLLATTLSRCQVVRFGAVDEERIAEKLTDLCVDQDEAIYWARFSEGSIGTALSWATLKLKDTSCYQIKRRLIDSLADQTLGGSLDLAEWFCKASATISKGLAAHHEKVSKKSLTRLAQKGLLKMAICAFADAVKVHLGKDDILTNFDQHKQIIKLAGRNDIEQSAGKIEKTYENLGWVDASVNEKLIFEELLLNYAV
ncbi:MAG: hypothetical protein KAJ07_07340 [Planctomycetes bacterium]|nr:hypothetical protein [Planctomycetota bacterium]